MILLNFDFLLFFEYPVRQRGPLVLFGHFILRGFPLSLILHPRCRRLRLAVSDLDLFFLLFQLHLLFQTLNFDIQLI
jgi:hypothetical protein